MHWQKTSVERLAWLKAERFAKSVYQMTLAGDLSFLPLVCRANLALPESIMLSDCRYCRRQLAHAAGRPELQERLFDHMVNLDCTGAEVMRKTLLDKAPWHESKNNVLFLRDSVVSL